MLEAGIYSGGGEIITIKTVIVHRRARKGRSTQVQSSAVHRSRLESDEDKASNREP